MQADQVEALRQELHSLKKLVRRGSGAAAVEAPIEQGAMGAKLARLARWAPAQLGGSNRHSRTNSTAEAGQDKSPTSGRMSQSSPKTGAPSDARSAVRERLRELKSLHDEGLRRAGDERDLRRGHPEGAGGAGGGGAAATADVS